MYWAIRAYEIAIEEGIRFFVYGNLDYALKKAGYDSRFRAGHYDGKGRIGEWILFQNEANRDRMGAAVVTTGPYMEMAVSAMTPMTPSVEDGVVTWRVPLGGGRVSHVALGDCGHYARWLFDNPDRANGMNLEVAIEQVDYHELAAAFERVTGHPARYIDTSLEDYWGGPLRMAAGLPAGYNADPEDKSTMSFRDDFTGFGRLFSATTRSLTRFTRTASRQSKSGSGGKTNSARRWAMAPSGRGFSPKIRPSGCRFSSSAKIAARVGSKNLLASGTSPRRFRRRRSRYYQEIIS